MSKFKVTPLQQGRFFHIESEATSVDIELTRRDAVDLWRQLDDVLDETRPRGADA